MADKNVVFGIDRMQFIPVSSAGVDGTKVAVLGRSLSFENETDDDQLEANNQIIDTRYFNKRASGSGEIAQHTPAVMSLLGSGAAVTTVGTAPNQTFTHTETTAINQGFVTIQTRSYAGLGTIVETKVYWARSAGPSFDLGTGAYAPVTFDFTTTGNATQQLWAVISYEGTSAASIEFP